MGHDEVIIERFSDERWFSNFLYGYTLATDYCHA